VAEFLMVLSLVFIGYSSQNPSLQNTASIEAGLFMIDQELSFVAMLIAKGFTIYGLMIVVLTINRLTAELSNPDFDENDYAKSPFNWVEPVGLALAETLCIAFAKLTDKGRNPIRADCISCSSTQQREEAYSSVESSGRTQPST
jgi:hypothetical protein